MFHALWFRLVTTFKSIRHHPYTAIFTVMSYTLGLMLPVIILCTAYQEMTALQHSFMHDSDRIIRVALPIEQTNDLGLRNTTYDELSQQLIELDDQIEQVYVQSQFGSFVTDGVEYRTVQLFYLDEAITELYPQFVTLGEWFHEKPANKCIIGTALARRLWHSEGINKDIRIHGKPCTIIGETDIFQNGVVKLVDAQERIIGQTNFYLKLKQSSNMDTVLASIRQHNGPFQAYPVDQLNQDQWGQAFGAFSVLLSLSLVVLIYALANIGNVIGLLLQERRKKLGIQLALGSKRRSLLLEFYVELVLMTSSSVLLVYLLISISEPWIEHFLFPIRINGFILLILLLFNLVLCLILGLWFMKKNLTSNIVPLIRGTES